MDIIPIVAATCLAMNVYLESRSEPEIGQLAVAQVTVRRAGYRPDRLCEVVMARKQFSWTANTDGNGAGGLEEQAWRQAQSVARRAILWGYLRHFPDHSAGATHYATGWIQPYWATEMRRTAKIGRHVFYRKK
jgi:spore germination cell wall hydrolase CwlJ-like protein